MGSTPIIRSSGVSPQPNHALYPVRGLCFLSRDKEKAARISTLRRVAAAKPRALSDVWFLFLIACIKISVIPGVCIGYVFLDISNV